MNTLGHTLVISGAGYIGSHPVHQLLATGRQVTVLGQKTASLLENLTPAVQLFAEVAQRGRKLVLVSSGRTVYGEANSLPITENHPTKPISQYGETKPEHIFDVKANMLDSTKLQKLTGWKPQVEFKEGLRRTFEWLRSLHA